MTPDPSAPPPIDPGEAALAVIGVSTIIDGEMPRVGVEKTHEIATLGKRIQEAARDVAAGKTQKVAVPRPQSYRTLLDRLSRGLTPDQVQELVQKFPPEASDMSGPFSIAVQQCMDHLKSIFPTSEYVTFTGPRTMTPPEDVVFDFLLQYMVIDQPMRVFMLMAGGALLRSQALAVQQFFPTFSKNVTAAMYEAIGKEKAAAPTKYQLRIPVADSFKIWKGDRTAEYQPAPVPRIIPQVKRPNPNALQALTKLQQPQNPQEV